eukprot:1161843-Pelagomonas_calceolata.AAC.11
MVFQLLTLTFVLSRATDGPLSTFEHPGFLKIPELYVSTVNKIEHIIETLEQKNKLAKAGVLWTDIY